MKVELECLNNNNLSSFFYLSKMSREEFPKWWINQENYHQLEKIDDQLIKLNKEYIGFVTFVRTEDIRMKNKLILNLIYIKKEFRNKGFGTEIFKNLPKDCIGVKLPVKSTLDLMGKLNLIEMEKFPEYKIYTSKKLLIFFNDQVTVIVIDNLGQYIICKEIINDITISYPIPSCVYEQLQSENKDIKIHEFLRTEEFRSIVEKKLNEQNTILKRILKIY